MNSATNFTFRFSFLFEGRRKMNIKITSFAVAVGVAIEQVSGHSREHIEADHTPPDPGSVFSRHLAATTQSTTTSQWTTNRFYPFGVTE